MNDTRPTSLTVAGLLLGLASLGYLGLVILAALSGEVYLATIDETHPIAAAPIAMVFGPLIIIGALLARKILAERLDRMAAVGFMAWFAMAVLGAVIIDPRAGFSIALTALVPLGLVWYGTRPAARPIDTI